MSDVSPRIVDWLSSVLDLLREPMTTMPTQKIMDRLRSCYDSTAASWNWRDPDGAFGMISAPKDILVARSTRAACQVGAANDTGSMMAFATDQGPRSQAHSSIPAVVVSGDRRLIHLGMKHQLSIPYRLDETMFRNYIVARGGKDYSNDDLMLARHIQQSLITVDQQICVLAHLSAEHGVATTAADFKLIGREMAVLQLLTAGRTTRASARRLRCAPRTVEKHLERWFRKLGVRDRLNAVRVATQAGLVTHSQAQGMGDIVGPSAP